MPCCGCKGDGTCIRCQCTNAGRPCVRCYPSRRQRCANPAKQRPLGIHSSSQQDLPSTSRLAQSQPLPNRVTTTLSQRTRSRSSESYESSSAQPSSARAATACRNEVRSSIDDDSADGRASIPVFGSSVGTLSSCPMSAIADTMATNQPSSLTSSPPIDIEGAAAGASHGFDHHDQASSFSSASLLQVPNLPEFRPASSLAF